MILSSKYPSKYIQSLPSAVVLSVRYTLPHRRKVSAIGEKVFWSALDKVIFATKYRGKKHIYINRKILWGSFNLFLFRSSSEEERRAVLRCGCETISTLYRNMLKLIYEQIDIIPVKLFLCAFHWTESFSSCPIFLKYIM